MIDKLTKQGIRDLSAISPKKPLARIVEIPPNRVVPQIFKLFVSYNCGMQYYENGSGTEEELLPRMKKFDEAGLRWYTEDEDREITHI